MCLFTILNLANNDGAGKEIRFVEAERAAIAHGAAKNSAQDVVAVVIAGLDAVGDGERKRADVVGDDAEGDVDGFCRGRTGVAVSTLFPVILFLKFETGATPYVGQRLKYFFPLNFSSLSKIGRKMSVS